VRRLPTTRPPLGYSASTGWTPCGGSGIRTHGTPTGAQQFSRLPPSSARPSLQGRACHESLVTVEAAGVNADSNPWVQQPAYRHTATSRLPIPCGIAYAEGVGFEPTEPGIPVQQFSRLPPSSARPPLQGVATAAGAVRPAVDCTVGRLAVALKRATPEPTVPLARLGGTPPVTGGRPSREQAIQRRARKNSSRTAAHSSARTPAIRSQRWLSRSSWGML
jgi:hypothetical protein